MMRIAPEQEGGRVSIVSLRSAVAGDGLDNAPSPRRWFDQPSVLAACARMALSRGSEPLLCVVERAGRPVFALALRTRRRLGLCEAIPLAAPLAQDVDGMGAAPTSAELRAIWKALRAELGVDLIVLRKLRSEGGVGRALCTAQVAPSVETTAPFIDLAAFGNFPNYEASFSSKTRRARRQRRQAAEKALGPLSFSAHPLGGDPDDHRDLEQALAWKREWLHAHGRISAVIGTPWEKALVEAASAGRAILSTLKVNGRLVAAELGMPEDQSFRSYLGAFDPALSRYSLGQLQMLDTIAWCFAANFARYDLLAPADAYKIHWTRAKTTDAMINVCIPLSPLGRLCAAIEPHARGLAKRAAATWPGFAQSALARLV